MRFRSILMAAGLVLGAAAFSAASMAGPAERAAPAAVFRDCPDCAEMIRIPAGAFLMGAPDGEFGREADEGPQRRVTVRAFAIGRYEVTRGEYAAFAHETRRISTGGCSVFIGGPPPEAPWRRDPAASWNKTGFAQTGRHPVACVSWEDATAYAAWLSRKTGRHYRLPTEAEWEYAARAGGEGRLYWGGVDEEICAYASLADKTYHARWPHLNAAACDDGALYTTKIGSFRPNGFGLYDVLGNVWEMTQDCYEPGYGVQPIDGSAYLGGTCERRTARGGGWHTAPGRELRMANRNGRAPKEASQDLGFRLARDL